MQKYYFQAVTKDDKQLAGTMSGKDEQDIHAKLDAQGMAVLSIELYNAEKHGHGGLQVFDYEGVNSKKQHVRGTIEGKNEYEAYKKLRMDCKLEVQYIVPDDLPEERKELLKKMGIDSEMEKRVNLETKIEEKKDEKNHRHTAAENYEEIETVVTSHKKEIQFMRDQIDRILTEIVPLVQQNSDYIDPERHRDIERKIDLLARLRQSNSVDHLRQLTKKLLDELQDDALFLESENISPELRQELEERSEAFKRFGSRFDTAISKGMAQIQIQLASLDVKEIEEQVADAHPVRKFCTFLYCIFIGLFSAVGSFWLWLFFESFVMPDLEMVRYYLHSASLWYLTVVSAVAIVGFAYPILFSRGRELNLAQNTSFVGGYVAFLLVFTLQFPVIFYWI